MIDKRIQGRKIKKIKSERTEIEEKENGTAISRWAGSFGRAATRPIMFCRTEVLQENLTDFQRYSCLLRTSLSTKPAEFLAQCRWKAYKSV